jgi:ubiquinone/menaquinone biosynthesis C-methylase UbiE
MAADSRNDDRYRRRYETSGEAALIAVEFDALGTDYQANGYTTKAQADVLGTVLDLGPGDVLLDLGSGCGWPGLYLAKSTGCSLVSLDPVDEGIETARSRACADGLGERSLQIRATAVDVPLRSRSVDGVVHTDVLC